MLWVNLGELWSLSLLFYKMGFRAVGSSRRLKETAPVTLEVSACKSQRAVTGGLAGFIIRMGFDGQ